MVNKEQHISQVFTSEQGRITNFVKKQVGSLEEAEDIVQDVFYYFSDGFDEITDLQKSISWIYKVAKNKVIDFIRKKKTYALEDQHVTQEEGDEFLNMSDLLPSHESLPDNQMTQNLIWEEVNWCLAQLPDEQREVFEKHELEGISFQKISEDTGDSVNTLISRKRYAVLRLREHLAYIFKEIND